MATDTITKPSFREVVGVTTINLDDVGLQFNAEVIAHKNFLELRHADYGKGFRMSILPELVPLVYASLKNQECSTAKRVIRVLTSEYLTGNTAVRYGHDGMFIQHGPIFRDHKLYMTPLTLEKRLGTLETRGAIFSDDKKVVFVKKGFQTGDLTLSKLVKHPVVIALTGSEENAEKTAIICSDHLKVKPSLCALTQSYIDLPRDYPPEIRVASMNFKDIYCEKEEDNRFIIDVGDYLFPPLLSNRRCSFGVRKLRTKK